MMWQATAAIPGCWTRSTARARSSWAYPTWGTLIGLLDGDEPVLGIMNQPFTRESASGVAPNTSYMLLWHGGRARADERPGSAQNYPMPFLPPLTPDCFRGGMKPTAFAAIQDKCTMTRYGGDCYGYCMLAAGFVDIIVESGLNSFDVMALIPIVERAGGRMTAWDGSSAINGGRILAAATPRLHKQAMKILS